MFYSLDFLRTSSLGGGLSDCSDRLLWRGKAGARVYRSFCDKDQVAGISKDYCSFKKTRHLKFKNSVLVYVWEDARLWVHWNHTFDVHLSSLWPASCSFLSQVPSGLTVRPLQWLDGCDILCLLKWQTAFFIHNLKFRFHWHSAFSFAKSGNHNEEHSPTPLPLLFVGWFLFFIFICIFFE